MKSIMRNLVRQDRRQLVFTLELFEHAATDVDLAATRGHGSRTPVTGHDELKFLLRSSGIFRHVTPDCSDVIGYFLIVDGIEDPALLRLDRLRQPQVGVAAENVMSAHRLGS